MSQLLSKSLCGKRGGGKKGYGSQVENEWKQETWTGRELWGFILQGSSRNVAEKVPLQTQI
jgi:hypothetical protein